MLEFWEATENQNSRVYLPRGAVASRSTVGHLLLLGANCPGIRPRERIMLRVRADAMVAQTHISAANRVLSRPSTTRRPSMRRLQTLRRQDHHGCSRTRRTDRRSDGCLPQQRLGSPQLSPKVAVHSSACGCAILQFAGREGLIGVRQQQRRALTWGWREQKERSG